MARPLEKVDHDILTWIMQVMLTAIRKSKTTMGSKIISAEKPIKYVISSLLSMSKALHG